ncbi:hypothetical protein [Salinimicrobium marinum]|uniref:hypothetical protein n=1 Tax=Salinimicrobium marinum TaxID=680283 RepID=UPI001E57FE9D|nr:hypothetical protein [Salinimicrobium marinum]
MGKSRNGSQHKNPIELVLYFERFLNESRKSPLDFDFSWKDHQGVITYIFSRYENG